MKILFTLLSLCFLLWCPQTGRCQDAGFLTGAVQDEKGVPVPFATVAVVQEAPATISTGTVAEESGRFRVKAPAAGAYRLRVSALGYVT
ncbi:hypothetical protein GCM10023185_27310 [Hymenobacter saemangeumensis]|uniref:Carboxypeptidase-like regulatory domain-containing protein n=1 Tax=Hymenobacter saemangeumensis TaxID=1084522 RepID=A0ABP8IJN4_9BACT